jgi:hypothetical protein
MTVCGFARAPMFAEFPVVGFLREDGTAEVELGETRVMGYVTAQLVQPYKDRPNEGTLAIFAEFSPMADPAYEPGRPGEAAIELGRVIDRGLRYPNFPSDLLWSNILTVEFNDEFCQGEPSRGSGVPVRCCWEACLVSACRPSRSGQWRVCTYGS